jgi:hypothetical protein
LFNAKAETPYSLVWLAAIQIVERKQNLPALATGTSDQAPVAPDMRRKLGTIKLIDKLFARAGKSIDALMIQTLAEEFDDIERIDRLTTIAENRRNSMLREIDRRRAVLDEPLRRQVQEVEAEFEVIEKIPAAAKSAA